MSNITNRDIHPRIIVLILLAVMLALMPAPVRASCLLPASTGAPQPLAEPCDSVLLSYSGVNINIFTFDVALALAILVVPVLAHRLYHILLDHLVQARPFGFIPDPPPPRLPV